MDIRMGEPGQGNAWSPMDECIVHEEGTRGSETSKYPEEKKEKSIPLVVASEEGRGQTVSLRTHGVAGERHLTIADLKLLERGAKDGDSPVREGKNK